MKRFLAIVSLVCAVGLVIAGARWLMEASRLGGWEAAGPAVKGVACFIVAAVFIGRHATGILTYPVTSLLGHVFYPESYYTEPPRSLLRSLRGRISEGRFGSVEQQIDALLEAYPRHAGLYHVWALLEAAKGHDVAPVTAEASRALSAKAFAEYEALLHSVPVRKRELRAG
jgi:hypothetical protein